MAIRKLTAAEVTFEVTIEAEDTPVRGNFMATDEPDLDKAEEGALLARLERGEVEAWCGVIVTATWEHDGLTYEGRDSLWGCSLNDSYTAAVVAEHHGMQEQALDDLNRTLEAAVTKGSKLARTLRARKAS